MKNVVKPLSLVVGLGIFALVMLLVDSRSVDAQSQHERVTLPTHLGVPTASLITLACLPTDATTYPSCTSFRQVSTAGVQASTDFTIPTGETLVVTDIDWEATFSPPGQTVFLNFACSSGCAFIYSSSTVSDSVGIAARQDHLTSGLFLTYMPTVSVGDAPHLSEVQLHGYLTSNASSETRHE